MADTPGSYNGRFPQTHPSMIRIAADPNAPGHKKALEDFLTQYRRVFYSRARLSGLPSDDADEVTQIFLIECVEKNLLGDFDPKSGRLRNFLLTRFKGVVSNFLRARRRRPDAVSLDDDPNGVALKDLLPNPSALEPCEEYQVRWDWQTFQTSVDNVASRQKDPVNVRILTDYVAELGERMSAEGLAQAISKDLPDAERLTAGALRVRATGLRTELAFELWAQVGREHDEGQVPEGEVDRLLETLSRYIEKGGKPGRDPE